MTDHHRNLLRRVMMDAWSRFRAEGGKFAAALRTAWKREKRAMAYARKFMARARASGGYVQLSPDLTRSPTKSKLRGQRYAGAKAYNACRGRGAFGL